MNSKHYVAHEKTDENAQQGSQNGLYGGIFPEGVFVIFFTILPPPLRNWPCRFLNGGIFGFSSTMISPRT